VSYVLTSESVTEGHPDKVCDFIADSILDACMEQDPESRVACEVLCKDDLVVLAGEISSRAAVDCEAIAREAVREIGYVDPGDPFQADGLQFIVRISRQAAEIGSCVTTATDGEGQGAGDQGLMFGYATDETPELMPLPILLAHRLSKGLADDRHAQGPGWLRPDGKTQVSVEYSDGRPVRVVKILVSTQHAAGVARDEIRDYVVGSLAPRVLGDWMPGPDAFIVNPSGSFVLGGPSADCGVTGRKIIVDTYGGAARHGGGAFSGKDASKVDRSGAYFCRYVARQVVLAGLARRAEVQVAYAIGQAKPVSVMVETFRTGDAVSAARFVEGFDFSPAAVVATLQLRRPVFRATTNYGHFGKPYLSWESPGSATSNRDAEAVDYDYFEDRSPAQDVSAVEVARHIDLSLAPAPGPKPASGGFLTPYRYASIHTSAVAVLRRAGWPSDVAEERLRENGLDEVLEQGDLGGLRSVVYCSVSSSMVSGSWGLVEFRAGGRGYICNQADSGIGADENLPILAAWEPAEDEMAREDCILRIYEENWDRLVLPPSMGEWASGDSALLTRAIARVVKGHPTAWGELFERLNKCPEVKNADSEAVSATAALIGMSAGETGEVLRSVKGSIEQGDAKLSEDQQRAVIALYVICISRGSL